MTNIVDLYPRYPILHVHREMISEQVGPDTWGPRKLVWIWDLVEAEGETIMDTSVEKPSMRDVREWGYDCPVIIDDETC
jgi:hypothetical protein